MQQEAFDLFKRKLIDKKGRDYFISIFPEISAVRKYITQLDVLNKRIDSGIKKLEANHGHENLLNIIQMDYENWVTVAYRLLKTLARIKECKSIINKKGYKDIMATRSHLIDHTEGKDGFRPDSLLITPQGPFLKPFFSQDSKQKDKGLSANKINVYKLLIEAFSI